jgi:DNA-binding IclR family transcriptional regulator
MKAAKSSASIPSRHADAVGGAQSIFRVLRILKYVGAAPARGVGLTDVVRDIGLTPPTAHRMLAALLQEGFLSLNPKLKTYSLGRESYILGLAAESRHGIKAIAESAVLRLAQSTGDTSFLSVRSGHEAVCVDRQTGDFPIKILTLEVGHRRPLGVGAGSLALLAFLPNEDIERVLARYDASAAPDLPSTDLLRADRGGPQERLCAQPGPHYSRHAWGGRARIRPRAARGGRAERGRDPLQTVRRPAAGSGGGLAARRRRAGGRPGAAPLRNRRPARAGRLSAPRRPCRHRPAGIPR